MMYASLVSYLYNTPGPISLQGTSIINIIRYSVVLPEEVRSAMFLPELHSEMMIYGVHHLY